MNECLNCARVVAVVATSACTVGLIACNAPTEPTKRIRVDSIRYERVYPANTPPAAQVMYLHMSIPITGEESGRSNIPYCVPRPSGDNAFVCDGLGWEVPVGEECWVQASDPALGRAVATTMFVNGQRVRRVEVLSNGYETGRFQMNVAGEIR